MTHEYLGAKAKLKCRLNRNKCRLIRLIISPRHLGGTINLTVTRIWWIHTHRLQHSPSHNDKCFNHLYSKRIDPVFTLNSAVVKSLQC